MIKFFLFEKEEATLRTSINQYPFFSLFDYVEEKSTVFSGIFFTKHINAFNRRWMEFRY